MSQQIMTNIDVSSDSPTNTNNKGTLRTEENTKELKQTVECTENNVPPVSTTTTSSKTAKPKSDSSSSSPSSESTVDVTQSGNPNETKDSPPFFYFPKFNVIQQIKKGDLVLREFESMCCDGSAVIIGFPSQNLTSSTVANYIIEQLNLPIVGDIISDSFPPFAIVRNGIPATGLRIHGNKRIVVFSSEFDLRDNKLQNDTIHLIYDFCVRHRSSMMIVVDGIVTDPSKKKKSNQLHKVQLEKKLSQLATSEQESRDNLDEDIEEAEEESNGFLLDDEDEDEMNIESKEDILKVLEDSIKEGNSNENLKKLFFSTNSESIGKKLLAMNHKPVIEFADLSLTAGILGRSSSSPVNVLCLLSPLNKLLQIGIRSSITIISCIDKLLSKEKLFDTSTLGKSAEELEKQIKNEISKLLVVDKDTSKSYNNMYM